METINEHFHGSVADNGIRVVDNYNDGERWSLYLNWRSTPWLTQESAWRYLCSLCDHVFYVRQAGRLLGVNETQLKNHDWTKFTDDEFPYYAAHFHGRKAGLDAAHEAGTVTDGFAAAWLHHLHFNAHHWQHWIYPDGFTPKGSSVENGVVRMPDDYVLEMVADWMGASMAYTGSWDMTDWLQANLPNVRLHSASWHTLHLILSGAPCDYSGLLESVAASGAWGDKEKRQSTTPRLKPGA